MLISVKKCMAVLFLFCIFMLCGCVKKEDKITIKFASWGSKSEIEIIKPIISEFENLNPDIKVDFMHIPQNYFQKIHLLFASNTPPDVIFINNLYLPLYADFLEELPVNKNIYFIQALDDMTYNGKLLAIHHYRSEMVITKLFHDNFNRKIYTVSQKIIEEIKGHMND